MKRKKSFSVPKAVQLALWLIDSGRYSEPKAAHVACCKHGVNFHDVRRGISAARKEQLTKVPVATVSGDWESQTVMAVEAVSHELGLKPELKRSVFEQSLTFHFDGDQKHAFLCSEQCGKVGICKMREGGSKAQIEMTSENGGVKEGLRRIKKFMDTF